MQPLQPTFLKPPLLLDGLLPLRFFKINVDGAASDDGRKTGIEVVIRDCFGNPVAVMSKTLPAVYIAETTKAFALHQGVLLASKMEISHAILKLDSLSLIQSLNTGQDNNEIGHILHDIILAKLSFSWWFVLALEKGWKQSCPRTSQRSKAFRLHSSVEGGHSPSNPACHS